MTRGGPSAWPFAMLIVPALLCGACAGAQGGADFSSAPSAELRPGPSDSYLALGRRLLAADEPALALKAFNTSLGTEGVSAEGFAGAGIAARRQGLLGGARRNLVQAIELAPNSATAYNNLGVVLFDLKEYAAARSAFRAALELSGEAGQEANAGSARRNLKRVEVTLARLDEADPDASARTHRLVRLGTDEFRLTPAAEKPARDEAALGEPALDEAALEEPAPEEPALEIPAPGIWTVAPAGAEAE